MNRLLQIQTQLVGVGANIAGVEKALGRRRSIALTSSLKSLCRVRERLEDEFMAAAGTSQVDVVSYRLFEGHERPTVALVGKALESFQALYTVLYASVSGGQPRDTAKLSSQALQQSAFEFSYAYSGSVGFVFTLPNERLLFGETNLDKAMEDLLLMTRLSSADEIKRFSLKFGQAPVRAMYNWANTLSASGVGADIQWRKDDDIKGSALLQPAEVEALRNLIDLTSDLEVDENTFYGVLLGYDSKIRVFRFEPSDGGEILKGTLAKEANLPPKVTIPERYSATIRTTSKMHYATGKADTSHELLSLIKA